MSESELGSGVRKAVISFDEPIEFVKMQGCGNHFVVIDARYGLPLEGERLAKIVCNPNFGIGADGLILLESSMQAEFRMSYFNPDGSTTTCGNGLRCTARFILENGLLNAEDRTFELETPENFVKVTVLGGGDRVRVDMGEPDFEGSVIPTAKDGEHIASELKVGKDKFKITAVSMGNPHCVIIVDDPDEIAVGEIAPLIEKHEFFPEKTNVEFVTVVNSSQLKLRIWERGVGETMSCGTGICATLAALVRQEKCDRLVAVQTRGGEVEVSWSEVTGRIALTGPADVVYRGQFVLSESMERHL